MIVPTRTRRGIVNCATFIIGSTVAMDTATHYQNPLWLLGAKIYAVYLRRVNEQIKEFWKGYGWKEQPIARSFRTIDWPDYAWHDPMGEPHPDTGLPPIDLNNLFKYAVLKLEDPEIKLYELDNNFWGAEVYWKSLLVQGDGETPALALFWALNKIKGDVK